MTQFVPAWSNENNNGFIGGLYVRMFGPMKAGEANEGHAHWIDHATFVEYGSVEITWMLGEKNGVMVVEAPNFIQVKAEAHHTIKALVDGTRYRCIFAAAEAEKLELNGEPIPFMLGKP